MGKSNLKQKLYEYIENGDSKLLHALYETAISYVDQKQLDSIIAEGEGDISNGRVHSQEDVQKMIEDWAK